jgi:hypothetical protein
MRREVEVERLWALKVGGQYVQVSDLTTVQLAELANDHVEIHQYASLMQAVQAELLRRYRMSG